MLSIGEFSKICEVSTKTLRYYAEIGLIIPDQVNLKNGYRYYSIEQLETMLLINRLKLYNFSLEEIKILLGSKEEMIDEQLHLALIKKKKEMIKQTEALNKTLNQMKDDILNLEKGIPIMSYLKDINIELVEVDQMNLLSIRKVVPKNEFEEAYKNCFGKLFREITDDKLIAVAPPMVLFHDSEFSPFGLDTEFAIPVAKNSSKTRIFRPGLCLKTVLTGSYSNLSSVYARQREWAEKEGYQDSDALYEVYVTDPSQVSDENRLVTEIYYPIKKRV